MATILYLVTEDWYFCSHRLAAARVVRDRGHTVVVATSVNKHGEIIRNEGFRLEPTRPMREGGLLSKVLGFVELVALVRRVKPDILHTFAIQPILLGSMAAWIAQVPVVINSFAGLGYLFISESLKARVIRTIAVTVLRHLHRRDNFHLSTQNPDDEATLRQYGIASGRAVTIIPGAGVDAAHYLPQPEPDGIPVAALVGRMLWDKGVGELVKAAEILRERGCSLRVVLVGIPDPANPASIPEETLRRWNAEGVVLWWGHVNDVRTVWAKAHIAVLPSYREGFPKSLLEAAACGRPLVATDAPGCREVVNHGDNGILVTLRDAVTLADALQKLADDPALRRRMGVASRSIVETRFTKEIIADHMIALYRQVLKD